MDLEKRMLRPTLTGPGAWVVAVLTAGNILLHAAPSFASSTIQEAMAVGVPTPILPKVILVGDPRMLPGGRIDASIGAPEPEGALFVWPAPMEVLRRPEPLLPSAMDYPEWLECRAQLVTDVYRRCGSDRLADIGDALLIWPELLFDGVSDWIGRPSGRPTVRTWNDYENRSVTGRMMDVQGALRHQRLSTVFLDQWIGREQKYLGEFEESRANTEGFQNRSEGADLRELGIDQRKIVLDALRRTYLARYKMQSEEHIPEEAWAFGRWNGLDLVVLPPLIGGLLYFRGLNRRISMGDTAIRIAFEPVSELLHRRRDRSVAAAVEWTVKRFPVGLIVSAGLHDGRYGMDFVGIGTSIGAARAAVDLQHDVHR